jgi:hypothetical protein
MKISILKKILLFAFFFSVLNVFASEVKEKVKVGIGIEDVYNIDYSSSTYEIVFWIWANSETEIFEIEKYMDIIGSTNIHYSFAHEDTLSNGLFHSERKVTARILNKFDVNHFPFDRLKLNLILEFVKDNADNCIIEFDKQSNLQPDYIGAERNQFETPKHIITNKYYPSNYGNDDLGPSTKYTQIIVPLELKRDHWNIFAKLFITLFIAFILASSSVLLPIEKSEEKFGIIVGSLFTSIGNKYITDELLPMSSNFNLSDRIHMLTFIFITLMAIFTIYEQRFKLELSKRADLMLFLGTISLYFIFIYIACFIGFG